MLSIIGLSLDVVGAVALAVGLFGRPAPMTMAGDLRSPAEVAHDFAFALIGAPLLLAGFVLQSSYYLDVRWAAPVHERLLAAGVTLGAASLVAYLSYGILYRLRLASATAFIARWTVGGQWTPPPPRLQILRWWLR